MNQSISVTGTGTAAAPPDLAVVNIGVDVMARSVSAARAVAAEHMDAVIAALRSRGVAQGQLTTTAYTINPEYDHRQGRRLLRGYRVSNMVEARVDMIDEVGEVIDAASEAASDHVVVHGLRFVHQDPSALEAEARTLAWKDAFSRAAQLAELAGIELGGVVGLSEQQLRPISGPPMRAMALEAAAPPIEAGELSVTVSIQVEFGIG